ncbi:MAG: peptidase [Frankiales bacterium]|nr:peptidase [Frankiales bacterium]
MTNALYGALLAAAAVSSPSPARRAAPDAVWVWPVAPPVVMRRFEAPPTPYAAGHRGVDLAAITGQEVEAAGAGVVSFAGSVAGSGVVVVRHGDLRTTYEPVLPGVSTGQRVDAGQVIGRVSGAHGGCTVCVHFGLRRGAVYLDPMLLFAQGPVRLVPVDGPAPPNWDASSVAAAGAGAAASAVNAPGGGAATPAAVVLGTTVTALAAYGAARRRRPAGDGQVRR